MSNSTVLKVAMLAIGAFGLGARHARAQAPRDVRSELRLPDSSRLQILTLRDGSASLGRSRRSDRTPS
jgi:hypothetical protein